MKAHSRSKAFALVLVLCLIVVVSSILIAFVTVMRMDRAATQSYSQGIRADQIALGAVQTLEDQIVAEIENGSVRYGATGTSSDTNGPYVFEPIARTDMVLQRAGTTTNAGTLYKVSKAGVPFFTNGPSLASAAASSVPAGNGRRITLQRWSKPALLTNGWSTNQAVPDWINVTRSGPQIVTISEAKNGALSNPKFVIGRYCYAVYDVGGLLDVSIAGFTKDGSDLTGRFIARKGSSFFADLAQIPNGSENLSAAQIDKMVKWRNKASLPTASSYATNYLGTNGGVTVNAGDNSFVNRQDLIRYAQANGMTNALPYLTAIHRSLNAPNYSPTTNAVASGSYAYKDNANSTSSINRSIANVRVKTGGWVRADGGLAVTGEPLLKNRFPLKRLGLLAETAANATDIQKYLGLSGSGGHEPWTYNHGSPGRIMTLEEVAAANREPDFFELLKAAILDGSLGRDPGGIKFNSTDPGVYSDVRSVSVEHDPQIFKIGANIIDQFDADNYPTTIFCPMFAPLTDSANFAYGIENLPYFTRLAPILRDVTPPAFDGTQSLGRCWVQPALWNPHQADVESVPTPAVIRVQASGVARMTASYSYTSPVPQPTPPKKVANGPDTDFSVDLKAAIIQPQPLASIDFRTQPVPLNEGNVDPAATDIKNIPSQQFPTATWTARPAGFAVDAMPYFPDGTTKVNPIYFVFQPVGSVSFALQWLDGTVWRTYANVRQVKPKMQTQVSPDAAGILGDDLAHDSYVSFDGRTDRFGMGLALFPANLTFRPAYLPVSGNKFVGPGPDVASGFLYGTPPVPVMPTASAGYFPASLAKNSDSGTVKYKDVDGISRMADGGFASETAASFPNGFPLATGNNTGSQRPIILNRPCRSVAELGYAFRDLPFKTIDLFTDQSADLGLLDVFSVDDAPIVAGKVNPNTAPAEVLQAILTGGLKRENFVGSDPASADLLGGYVPDLATNVFAQLQQAPLLHRGEMATSLGGALSAVVPTNNYADAGNKTHREAAIRSIADVSDVRTWNLFLDVIAQAGRYSTQATSLASDFMVEGEKRYWLHISIDRVTGTVISRQLEPVYE